MFTGVFDLANRRRRWWKEVRPSPPIAKEIAGHHILETEIVMQIAEPVVRNAGQKSMQRWRIIQGFDLRKEVERV